jgi:hypothetical protein
VQQCAYNLKTVPNVIQVLHPLEINVLARRKMINNTSRYALAVLVRD